jgi:hypothetical protein
MRSVDGARTADQLRELSLKVAAAKRLRVELMDDIIRTLKGG